MVRKTRRHSAKKTTGVYSIPELRRSFEHIEEFVDSKITDHESKEKIIKDVRREWSKVFLKELDRKSADAFVSERMSRKPQRRRTARVYGGAGAQLPNTQTPIAGAPNDYTTRAGIYLAPGQIPDKAGHLPLSDGAPSKFGSFVEYVSKGFWNPEPGQSYDPVPGQTRFPTSVPVGMGSNAVHFAAKGGSAHFVAKGSGKRRTRRRDQRAGGAGAMLQQAFTHPFSASVPASVLQDMQDKWYGKSVGPSPDQVQRSVDYKLGSVYPKPVTY
jgi:hypothetical protein